MEGNGLEGIAREDSHAQQAPPKPELTTEFDDFTLEQLGEVFSAARKAHGGGGWQPALSRTLAEECRQALETFRGEAKRKGKSATTLARESADAYCKTADSWTRDRGYPPGPWLKDPLRFLHKPRRKNAPASHADFGNDEEADDAA